jgi:hypothetical protein
MSLGNGNKSRTVGILKKYNRLKTFSDYKTGFDMWTRALNFSKLVGILT